LHNGTLSLVRARGIMPDGLAFEMPDCDPLPAPRPIADLFPPLSDRLTVYLGIPAYRFDAVNCTPPDAGPDSQARYLSRCGSCTTKTPAGREAVNVGRKNLQFYLETEISEDLVSMPLARVMRSGAGHFVYDPDFIPPCVQITASERLMGFSGD